MTPGGCVVTKPPGAGGPDLGPAELVLAATAARRFYLDGLAKTDIAAELGISRFKVARLLDWARTAGVVRIQVVLPAELDAELSERLRVTFNLRHAIVVDTVEPDLTTLSTTVGRVAGELLAEVATADDVIGIAGGRSLRAMTTVASSLPACTFVQLSGVVSHPELHENAVELVRRVAAAAGGRAATFYAPLVVPDAATADALRRQHGIADTLAQLDRLDTAVIPIGAWRAGESTVYDTLDDDERRRLAACGAHAETSGVLLRDDGPLADPFTDRVVGVTAEQLRRTPEVIALAYGDSKADAVQAVLRSGIVTSLVTHASLARAVLAAAPAGDGPAGSPGLLADLPG